VCVGLCCHLLIPSIVRVVVLVPSHLSTAIHILVVGARFSLVASILVNIVVLSIAASTAHVCRGELSLLLGVHEDTSVSDESCQKLVNIRLLSLL
jgi:hypothetical protein